FVLWMSESLKSSGCHRCLCQPTGGSVTDIPRRLYYCQGPIFSTSLFKVVRERGDCGRRSSCSGSGQRSERWLCDGH
ncbi:hypothetical protein STEG23_015928, partial [Scotinomys teguina]